MQEMDNRDRELLGALQGEIPLVSTPYAFIGQTLDMSEKEVIKRTERLKRDGVVRQVAAHFDARALGYRSCLVAARVSPSRPRRSMVFSRPTFDSGETKTVNHRLKSLFRR